MDICALNCWQSEQMQLPADHEMDFFLSMQSGVDRFGSPQTHHLVSCNWVVRATDLVLGCLVLYSNFYSLLR